MPICSQCSKEKSRDAFSKAQFRKADATRRCKQCINADAESCQVASSTSTSRRQAKIERRRADSERKHNESVIRQNNETILRGERNENPNFEYQPPPSPPPPRPLSAEYAMQIQQVISGAVQNICKRGVPTGVGLDGDGLNTKELLEARLWDILNNDNMTWLTVPMLIGLFSGKPEIDEKVNFLEDQEPHPIIMWLCQYKSFAAQFNYQGGDDMVALAIAAGADLSVRVSNGCNSLFFAMKYASARTVELLLDAGIKVDERDCYGSTVWKNAVERPNLDIIQVLVERCNSVIPVAEVKIPMSFVSGGPKRFWTLPDHMLSLYAGVLSFNNQPGTIPVSWRILGAPTVDYLATAIVRVLQAGARFSPTKTTSPDDAEKLDPLAFVTHVDAPRVNYHRHSESQLNIVRKLRDVVYGRWLPEAIRSEVQNVKYQSCSPDNTCPICLDEMEPSSTPITLYCGHKYCLDCIGAFGKSGDVTVSSLTLDEVVELRGTIQGTDKRCPICRRLLCGDLLSQDNLRLRRLFAGFRLGIDRHETDDMLSGRTRRGAHLLTDEQLRFECKVVIGKTGGTRESLLNKLSQSMSRSPRSESIFINNRNIPLNEENMKIELSASATMVLGTDNATVLQAPKWGPVVVPIQVKNVPILASLSPNSIFTVVPQAVVRSFGLKTKPIASSQFIDILGKHVGVKEVVDEFRFFLKDVEICLNNAIVLSKEPPCLRSVQLGMDFFETASWTRCSVLMEGDMYIVSDGGHTMNMIMKDQPDELRYYSRDGKICQVPFIHVSDLNGTEQVLPPIVSLPGDFSAQCAECRWCCRYFPCDGMLKYSDSTGQSCYYCDEDCKAKGLSIRTI